MKWTFQIGFLLLFLFLFYQSFAQQNLAQTKQNQPSTDYLKLLEKFNRYDTIFYYNSAMNQYADFSVIINNDSLEMLSIQTFYKKSDKHFIKFRLEDSKGNSKFIHKGDESQFDSSEILYLEVDIPPIFPGGEEALLSFILKNLRYPIDDKFNKIQGKVYVQFTVNKKGDVINVRIIKRVSPNLDKEAVRVISSLPKWSPGYVDNKPVNCVYRVPINFKLN